MVIGDGALMVKDTALKSSEQITGPKEEWLENGQNMTSLSARFARMPFQQLFIKSLLKAKQNNYSRMIVLASLMHRRCSPVPRTLRNRSYIDVVPTWECFNHNSEVPKWFWHDFSYPRTSKQIDLCLKNAKIPNTNLRIRAPNHFELVVHYHRFCVSWLATILTTWRDWVWAQIKAENWWYNYSKARVLSITDNESILNWLVNFDVAHLPQCGVAFVPFH